MFVSWYFLLFLFVTCHSRYIKNRLLGERYVWDFGECPPYEVEEHIDVAALDAWYNHRLQRVQAFLQERKFSSEGIRLCLLKKYRQTRFLPAERIFVRAAIMHGLHIEIINVRTTTPVFFLLSCTLNGRLGYKTALELRVRHTWAVTLWLVTAFARMLHHITDRVV
jgi:hypothetical protein